MANNWYDNELQTMKGTWHWMSKNDNPHEPEQKIQFKMKKDDKQQKNEWDI